MQENVRENVITGFKGFLGAASSGGGIYVSFLPQVEAWLRVAALVGGITVSVLTVISIVRNWRKP